MRLERFLLILGILQWICVTSFGQDPCSLWCPTTEQFYNTCTDCGNVVMAENCADASTPSINEIDKFSSSTCGQFPDGPNGLPGFCGPNTEVMNNIWIGFTPVFSGRLHLNIEIIDCLNLQPFCNGMQAAVSRALCSNPDNIFYGFEYETLACVNCVDQTFDLITNDAIGGVPHYIMMDGCCGDICKFRVHVIDGLGDDPTDCSEKIEIFTFQDSNENCQLDSNEPGIPYSQIEITDGNTQSIQGGNINGEHRFFLEPGNYNLRLVSPNDDIWETCEGIEIVVKQNEEYNFEIGAKSIKECAIPKVEILASPLRRCRPTTAHINYQNLGSVKNENSYIDIQFDEYTEIESSGLPFVEIEEGKYRFQIGTIEPLAKDVFQIQILTDCNAPFGKTHCIEADIYPREYCEPEIPDWDGSSLEIDGLQTDGQIIFTINNNGEDMESPTFWYLIENETLIRTDDVQLDASNGNQFKIELDCSEDTYRLEVEQSSFHPGQSNPSLSIEGCDTNFSPGLVNTFPQDDEDCFTDIACVQNVDSFDPNDKIGLPLGISDRNCIKPGTKLEYTIRFQNTGTAEAIDIEITDQLPDNLDLSTFLIIGSSHDFSYDITETGFLTFKFIDIDLPFSAMDEEGSNGLVKFSIFPKEDLPLGTTIENNAAIYFDFNDPIITNTTFHTIDDDCLEVDLVNTLNGALQNQASLYPNPFKDNLNIVFGEEVLEETQFLLFDINGKLMDSITVAKSNFKYSNARLATGVYFYNLISGASLIKSGRIIKVQ